MEAQIQLFCGRGGAAGDWVRWRFQGYGGDEMLYVGRPAGISADSIELEMFFDHWAAFLDSKTLIRVPPANLSTIVSGAPPICCNHTYCSADGRFYPSRCGGDRSGTGSSGNLTTAAENGCRVVFFGGDSAWSKGFIALHIEAHDLPLVITWVGHVGLSAYNDAAFAAGYDLTLFCESARLSALSPACLLFLSQQIELGRLTPCHYDRGAQTTGSPRSTWQSRPLSRCTYRTKRRSVSHIHLGVEAVTGLEEETAALVY